MTDAGFVEDTDDTFAPLLALEGITDARRCRHRYSRRRRAAPLRPGDRPRPGRVTPVGGRAGSSSPEAISLQGDDRLVVGSALVDGDDRIRGLELVGTAKWRVRRPRRHRASLRLLRRRHRRAGRLPRRASRRRGHRSCPSWGDAAQSMMNRSDCRPRPSWLSSQGNGFQTSGAGLVTHRDLDVEGDWAAGRGPAPGGRHPLGQGVAARLARARVARHVGEADVGTPVAASRQPLGIDATRGQVDGRAMSTVKPVVLVAAPMPMPEQGDVLARRDGAGGRQPVAVTRRGGDDGLDGLIGGGPGRRTAQRRGRRPRRGPGSRPASSHCPRGGRP